MSARLVNLQRANCVFCKHYKYGGPDKFHTCLDSGFSHNLQYELYNQCNYKKPTTIRVTSCKECPLLVIDGVYCSSIGTIILEKGYPIYRGCPYPKEPNSINFVESES